MVVVTVYHDEINGSPNEVFSIRCIYIHPSILKVLLLNNPVQNPDCTICRFPLSKNLDIPRNYIFLSRLDLVRDTRSTQCRQLLAFLDWIFGNDVTSNKLFDVLPGLVLLLLAP